MEDFQIPKAPEKSKSIFERIYKSKTARAVSLMMALGVGIELWPKEKTEMPTSPDTENSLTLADIQNISPELKASVEIGNTNERYVLHISQIHGGDNLEQTKDMINVDELIENQKNLEKLILDLKEKYGLNDFYVEGVLPDFLAILESVKTELREIHEKEGVDSLHYRIIELINTVKEQNIPDRFKAYLLELLKHKLASIASPEDPVLEQMRSNPLISGDNEYLWGVAVKLYTEGKINIIAAETVDANAKTFSAYNILEKLRGNEGVFRERQKIREDKAVEIITQNSAKKKLIPLVYGTGHDFKSSLKEYNRKNPKTAVGLIKLEHK